MNNKITKIRIFRNRLKIYSTINKVTWGYSVTRGNSVNANYLVVKIKFKLSFGHIMINLDEMFLTILEMFIIDVIELKFILLYCINRITPGHRISPGHLHTFTLKQNWIWV